LYFLLTKIALKALNSFLETRSYIVGYGSL
jgi:hypothetical protein